jgi:hypothetical protein
MFGNKFFAVWQAGYLAGLTGWLAGWPGLAELAWLA